MDFCIDRLVKSSHKGLCRTMRNKVLLIAFASCVALIPLKYVAKDLSVNAALPNQGVLAQERKVNERKRGKDFLRSHELSAGCSENRRGIGRRKKTRKEEISDNVSGSRVTEQDFVRLDKLIQESGDTVGEVSAIEKSDGEFIFESKVAQIQTITSSGVIRCKHSDKFTDDLMDSEEGVTFVGGPLDNQSSKK